MATASGSRLGRGVHPQAAVQAAGGADLFQSELRGTGAENKGSEGECWAAKLCSPSSAVIYAHVLVTSVAFSLTVGQVMNLFGFISPEAAKWRCGLQALPVGGIRMPGSVQHRAALIRGDLGHGMSRGTQCRLY